MVFDGLDPLPRAAASVAVFVALVAGSALVTATEAALLGYPRPRAKAGPAAAEPRPPGVARLLEQPQRVILTASVASSLLNVAAAAFATLVAADVWPNREPLVLAVVVGVGSFLILTGSQVVPRSVGAHRARAVATRMATPFRALAFLLSPVVVVYQRMTTGVLRLAGEPDAQAGAYANEEELKTLITIGAEEGILEGDEEEMIHSVLDLDETTAKEIMVPRADMVAVPADATLEHVRAFVIEAGYSRVPVYQGTLDNVVGVLLVKEMLVRLVEGKGSVHVRDLMKEPMFVPETKRLDELLHEMRHRRVHLAIVVDEYGGTAGLITLEDLLEEIVGEIFDEDDLGHESIRRVDDRTALVDARTHVEEVNAELGLKIPEDGPYDSIGGYVFHKLGRLGREGETVRVAEWDLVVDKVVNRRILRVKLVHRGAGPRAGGADADGAVGRAGSV